MAYHHNVSGFLTRFVARMRDRVSDEICVARIERFLERSVGADTPLLPAMRGEGDVRIEQTIAQMAPLTRSILILVVGRKMSVAQVARRFGMSEDRVCRHFRMAVEMVARSQ